MNGALTETVDSLITIKTSTVAGLSKLQRRILTVMSGFTAVTMRDLLERVCGWRPSDSDGRCARRADGGLFDREKLFYGMPHAPRVALSRAVQRLCARGLVEGPKPSRGPQFIRPNGYQDHGSTYSLTALGKATVDGWQICHESTVRAGAT